MNLVKLLKKYFLTSVLLNVVQKVQLEVDQPHHIPFFILNSFSDLTSNILKL